MNRNIKKLFDIEIDEVSVVDRPANQHGLIAFAKNDTGLNEEESMADEAVEVYDADGVAVDTDVLENGDVVFDDEGNEYVFVEDSEDDEDFEDDIEDEEDDVEKMMSPFARNAFKAKFATQNAMGKVKQSKAGEWAKKNPGKALAGAGAGIGAGGYMAGSVGKQDEMSLGDSILEELSKAVTEYDREAIIAKAMDEVEIAKAQAVEALEYAAAIEDARVTDAFISKAAEYNLPVSAEVFGPILKSIAETLTEEELDLLDELFSSIGDSLYNEIGYVGESSNNSVLDTVNGLASEFVGKSDATYEQAFTAMFEANPSAYDAYLAENGR
jgi:hypothetical protein